MGCDPAHDLCIVLSEHKTTLPDAPVAGNNDRHGLSGQEPRALSGAQFDPEQAMHPRSGAGVIEPDGVAAGDGQLEVEQPA
jgi:hypothetical protein